MVPFILLTLTKRVDIHVPKSSVSIKAINKCEQYVFVCRVGNRCVYVLVSHGLFPVSDPQRAKDKQLQQAILFSKPVQRVSQQRYLHIQLHLYALISNKQSRIGIAYSGESATEERKHRAQFEAMMEGSKRKQQQDEARRSRIEAQRRKKVHTRTDVA